MEIKGKEAFEYIKQNGAIRDLLLSRVEFNNQDEGTNIVLTFTLGSNVRKPDVIIEFIEVKEFSFYYIDGGDYYIEDFKFFYVESEGLYYLSLDPYMSNENILDEDNDIIRAKDLITRVG